MIVTDIRTCTPGGRAARSPRRRPGRTTRRGRCRRSCSWPQRRARRRARRCRAQAGTARSRTASCPSGTSGRPRSSAGSPLGSAARSPAPMRTGRTGPSPGTPSAAWAPPCRRPPGRGGPGSRASSATGPRSPTSRLKDAPECQNTRLRYNK